MNCTIQVETQPRPEEIQFIWDQLLAYNRHYSTIVDDYRRLTIFARNAVGDIVGGLVGGIGWEWLHIDLLWVHESCAIRASARRCCEGPKQKRSRPVAITSTWIR